MKLAAELRRRGFFGCLAGTAMAGLAGCDRPVRFRAAEGKGAEPLPAAGPRIPIAEFDAAGRSLGVADVPKIVLSEDAWKERLDWQVFLVTRRKGTEPAYSGPLNKNKEKGLYRCGCCRTALFSSETKFESGTGWPSFWQPIAAGNVQTETDRAFGIERTEVLCARCDAHLGHVFEDGPEPTGLRYCMNSLALVFERA